MQVNHINKIGKIKMIKKGKKNKKLNVSKKNNIEKEKENLLIYEVFLDKIDFIIKDHKGLKKTFIFILLFIMLNLILEIIFLKNITKLDTHSFGTSLFSTYHFLGEKITNYCKESLYKLLNEKGFLFLSAILMITISAFEHSRKIISKNKQMKRNSKPYIINFIKSYGIDFITGLIFAHAFLNQQIDVMDDAFKYSLLCVYPVFICLYAYRILIILMNKHYDNHKQYLKTYAIIFSISLIWIIVISLYKYSSVILLLLPLMGIYTFCFIANKFTLPVVLMFVFFSIKDIVFNILVDYNILNKNIFYDVMYNATTSIYYSFLLSLFLCLFYLSTRVKLLEMNSEKKTIFNFLFLTKENACFSISFVGLLSINILMFLRIIDVSFYLWSSLLLNIFLFYKLTTYKLETLNDKKVNFFKKLLYVCGTYFVFYGVISACNSIYISIINLILK